MKKLRLILMVFAVMSATALSAQKKMEDKAAEMTKEFSAKLGTAKLTAEQEQKVTAIYVEKMNEVKEMKKAEADEAKQKEMMKEINKKYAKRINDEILTPEQKTALKEYNKNKEKKQ